MDIRFPFVFIALIVVGLILVFRNKRTSISDMLNIRSEHLRDQLFKYRDDNKIRWKKRIRLTGILLLIISASGIQIGSKVKPVERKGIDLIFAVDVSVSMNAEDVKPNRLEKAKFEINQIIRRLKGDRVGIIDDKGNEIFSDKIGLLIARNLSGKHKKSKFIVDVKSTGLYLKDNVLLKNGCKTIYWKTGHSHIKRKVNREKALAGFEKSGHFFFNKPIGYGYDDGINSAIQICHLLNAENKKMSSIINDLPKTFQSPTMAPYCKDEEKYKVVENIVKQMEEIKNKSIKIDDQLIKEILTVNGVRFVLEDGSWGLIRASSNKPSLVVVTESTTSNQRKKKIFEFIDALLQKTGKIGKYDQKI